MKLYEYQAKELLKKWDIPVPEQTLIVKESEVERAYKKLKCQEVVLKAQVLAGGRGKAGGIQFACSSKEARQKARALLGKSLVTHQTEPEGEQVTSLLMGSKLPLSQEFYAGITIDRDRGAVLMVSALGGMDIEAAAKKVPGAILMEELDLESGLYSFQARRLAYDLGLKGQFADKMSVLLLQLANAFIKTDAVLIEINPLALTKAQELLAIDAKIILDDSAAFRQEIFREIPYQNVLDPRERRARENNLSFISMQGNIGCMVNGAGLAMATLDLLTQCGGNAANFLDVGGGVRQEQVTEAFRILLADKKIEVILVNIFGGIVHCDVIAQGILHAVREISLPCPLVVRLEGTNSEKARQLLEAGNLSIHSALSMREAAELAVKMAERGGYRKKENHEYTDR